MGYSNFKKIQQVADRFGLDHELASLFPKIKPIKPSRWLAQTLLLGREMPLSNEKVKAERIISPILLEVSLSYKEKCSLFSGEDLPVDPAYDLSGACDFFFCLHKPKLAIQAPIISLCEAKDEDMEMGIGQCAAQMYGAKLFNEQRNKPIEIIYGCATTGDQWQFIKLDNGIFYVDKNVLTNINEVIGTWHYILDFYTGVHH